MAQPISHQMKEASPAVLSNAAVRAADMLGLDECLVAATIGIPESAVANMRDGKFVLARESSSFERSVLLIRMTLVLDTITAGDHSVAKAWLWNWNNALGGSPINLIQTTSGLATVAAYLDSRASLA